MQFKSIIFFLTVAETIVWLSTVCQRHLLTVGGESVRLCKVTVIVSVSQLEAFFYQHQCSAFITSCSIVFSLCCDTSIDGETELSF